MNTNQTPTPIDETVIEALRAQARRYDVAIDDELVLSVLPNGAKTWTWVYDDPADPHRKTLGIYPDMSLEDAKKSLSAEKASYRRAGTQDPKFVIRDGRIESTAPVSQLPIIIGAVVAVIAVAIIALLMMSDGDDSSTDTDDSSPFVASPTETNIQLPTISQSPPETAEDFADTVPVNPTARIDAATPPPAPTPDPVRTASAIVNEAPPSTPVPDPATTVTDMLPPDPVTTASATDGEPPSMTATASATVDEALSQNTRSLPAGIDRQLGDQTPSTTVEPGTAASTVTPQNDSTSQSRTPVGTLIADNNTDLIVDSRVARGNLTTAMSAREPIDDLGSYIAGTGEELQTYYFFTELRQLAGQRVRHRWLHQDRVVAEIPFTVGEAWRWRVYSSKTFIPSMAGQWQVQVVLEDDTVIYNLPFTFTP